MKKITSAILPLVALALFALAFTFLRNQLSAYSWTEIYADLIKMPYWQIGLAAGVTLISYGLLIGYDALALSYAHQKIPLVRLLFAGFTGFAFSNNLGAPIVTGGILRFRLYATFGIKATDIAKIVVYLGVAFWIGVLAAGGLYLTIQPSHLSGHIGGHIMATRYLGFLFVIGCMVLLLICAKHQRELKVWKWKIALPSRHLAIRQLLLGVLDWTVSGTVLYCLLPRPNHVPFTFFIGAFILTQVAGFLSHVPGGIGILESSILAVLKPYYHAPQLIGVLLVYRLIYYFIPLFIASIMMGGYEVERFRRSWKARKTRALGHSKH